MSFRMGFFDIFDIIPIISIIFFLTILILIIIQMARAASNYKKNASSPILEQHAKVISKRSEVTGHSNMNSNSSFHNTTHTRYYVTFETDAGQRMELTVSGRDFGMLVEGDRGKLTYQGEWFKKFDRDMI